MSAEKPGDLTDVVQAARRGLRRDVASLVDALEQGELLIPLAREISDAPIGERIEIGDELRLSPHLLVDPEERRFAALFTRPDLLETVAEHVGWATDGGPLKYCTLPARVAFDIALSILNDPEVPALVINAGADSELFLRREELASIHSGRALPLVGYVSQIPEQDDERTLIAEPGEPPPPALIAAIERALAEVPEVRGYTLRRTFNAERDLEPHLTLALSASLAAAKAQTVAERMFQAVENHLPPPGYIDIVFQD
jgi:hypothetical protein